MRVGMEIPAGQTPLCPAAHWLELHLYGASALGRYNKQIQALNGDAGRPGASPRFVTLPLTKEGVDLAYSGRFVITVEADNEEKAVQLFEKVRDEIMDRLGYGTDDNASLIEAVSFMEGSVVLRS